MFRRLSTVTAAAIGAFCRSSPQHPPPSSLLQHYPAAGVRAGASFLGRCSFSASAVDATEAAAVPTSASSSSADGFRCFAVIAHVDHGKTTLLDSILSQCSSSGASERFLDDNSIERERGITIFSKYNSFMWRGVVLNAVDSE